MNRTVPLLAATIICLMLTSCTTQTPSAPDLSGLTDITEVKEITTQSYQHPEATQLTITVVLDTTEEPTEQQIQDMITVIANHQPEQDLINLTVTDENYTPFNLTTQVKTICPETSYTINPTSVTFQQIETCLPL